ISDALGFNAVKSGDKRSKVGEHFERIKKGLGDAKDKLKELSGEISEAKNANSSTIEAVKGAIRGSGDVFDKLIAALTNLAGVTKDNSLLGDTSNNAAAVAADANDVKTIIENVKTIIEVVDKSEVKIEKGSEGNAVAGNADTNAPAVLTHNAAAGQGATAKLADEVSKADPWAIIDKIKDATINTGVLTAATNYGAGELATGGVVANGAGAKTNADLAAAVALKSMTKTGKLSAHNGNNEADVAKAAAVSAVNKVLGVLDFIIRKTVSSNLDKIREAVKGIKYSETTGEATESDTAQPTAIK
ncbi:variable large family protein, partial [Borrelia hermsii]|uniref:variable large family protein n=1 Tax=Borrelia hermsii TaxID=140 RepID=UPI0012F738BF